MHAPTPVWWNPEQCFPTRLSIGHYHSVQADLPFHSSPVRARCRCRNSERCYKVLSQYSCEDPPPQIKMVTATSISPSHTHRVPVWQRTNFSFDSQTWTADVHVRQLFLLRKKTGAASTPGHLTCAAALNHNWELKNQTDRQGMVQDPETQGAYPRNRTIPPDQCTASWSGHRTGAWWRSKMQVARQW
jgi:hypothetical protein